MIVTTWQATYRNWDNEQCKMFFDNRAYARMFKQSMDSRGYLVKLELVNVEHTEIAKAERGAW